MNVIDLFNLLSDCIDALINLIPKVIALASVIAAFLPPTNPFAGWVNRIAFNFNHAENKN